MSMIRSTIPIVASCVLCLAQACIDVAKLQGNGRRCCYYATSCTCMNAAHKRGRFGYCTRSAPITRRRKLDRLCQIGQGGVVIDSCQRTCNSLHDLCLTQATTTTARIPRTTTITGTTVTTTQTTTIVPTTTPATTTTPTTTTTIAWYYQQLSMACGDPTNTLGRLHVTSVDQCKMHCNSQWNCGGLDSDGSYCYLRGNCEGHPGLGNGYKKMQATHFYIFTRGNQATKACVSATQTQWAGKYIVTQCCKDFGSGTCERYKNTNDLVGCHSGVAPSITVRTHQQAATYCRSLGNYGLCDKNCKNSGCRYNLQPLWTSLQCANHTATTSATVVTFTTTTVGGVKIIRTPTTKPIVLAEGKMKMEVSDAAHFVVEPTVKAILRSAIAELYNVSIHWIANVVVNLLDVRRLLLSYSHLARPRLSLIGQKRKLQSNFLSVKTRVGVSWTLEVPPGNRTHVIVSLLVEKFNSRAVSEVTQRVQNLIDNGLLGYKVNVTWKYVMAKKSATPQHMHTGSDSSTGESTPWLVYGLVIVVPCALASCLSIGGLWYCIHRLLPQRERIQKQSHELLLERNPTRSPCEFARKAGALATWTVEELMNPPEVISLQQGEQIRQLVRAMYQERMHDATVHITYASGHRERDAPGYGPGSFFAAAIIKSLHIAGLPCFSELLLPSDMNTRMVFSSKLSGQHVKCNVLLVLQTDELYKCSSCLKDLYNAQLAHIHMLPLRFDKRMPTEKTPWPQVTSKDIDGMIMTYAVQGHFCSLNSIPSPPYTVPEQPGVLEHVIEDLKTRFSETSRAVPGRKSTSMSLNKLANQDENVARTKCEACFPLVSDHCCQVQKYGNPSQEDSTKSEVCDQLSTAIQPPLSARQSVIENMRSGSGAVPPDRQKAINPMKSEGTGSPNTVGLLLPAPRKDLVAPTLCTLDYSSAFSWQPGETKTNIFHPTSSSTHPSRKDKKNKRGASKSVQMTPTANQKLTASLRPNASKAVVQTHTVSRGPTQNPRPHHRSKRPKHPYEKHRDAQPQRTRTDRNETPPNQRISTQSRLNFQEKRTLLIDFQAGYAVAMSQSSRRNRANVDRFTIRAAAKTELEDLETGKAFSDQFTSPTSAKAPKKERYENIKKVDADRRRHSKQTGSLPSNLEQRAGKRNKSKVERL